MTEVALSKMVLFQAFEQKFQMFKSFNSTDYYMSWTLQKK